MAPHSSTLAWKIPWKEEPGRLQSMGSLESDTTEWLHFHFSLFTFMHWRRKWQPTPMFLPGESQGRGACWAAVNGVAQSWTRLKRHSSGTVVECRQFNLMVIIYIWGVQFVWSTFTSIISLILTIEMWGRGYRLCFTDEKTEAHKTHPEFAFVPFEGYL